MRILNLKKSDPERLGWREYQARMQKPSGARHRRSWMVATVVALALGGMFYVVFSAFSSTAPRLPGNVYSGFSTATEPADRSQAAASSSSLHPLISKKDAQVLLSQLSLDQLIMDHATLPFKGQALQVQTSLDMELQSYLIKSMDLKNSRYIGIVVMEADTGRVRVLAGFDKTNPKANPCLRNGFPAASLFKIITAAAAVDQCHYTSDTHLQFNGYKHTLYKSQLKDLTNQYSNTVLFKDAFAQSVNPVFGKIGALRLGKTLLEHYGAAFGFNQPIDFELAVAPSRLNIGDDPYQWAEIASGFNNDTTISPLHGAMMASAVLNQGKMIAPTMIDSISDANGKLLYQYATHWHGQAMSAQAADTLMRMMETTVLTGTAKKMFRGLQRHPILSHLEIGGKTGSIYSRDHDVRFDWFVGFAREKNGPGRLAISVMVGHEEYIGIRAGQYARMAMTRFFENQLAQHAIPKSRVGG